jgi:dTDP-4-amino-4,6-dideoxygalactose transaminase
MITFYNLNEIHGACRKEIDSVITKTIDNNAFISTSHEFENDFATYTNSQHCIGTSSGTSAIHLSLLALGVGADDEVITVSHTYRATVAPIYYCGATPVYVDIDEKTFVMDWKQIETKITPKTKVIIPVHLYGNVAPMKEIMEIANRHNLYVIEDCSQAHGSTLNGIHVGNFGHIGTFSFYPGKGLGAFGDAGCVVTNDQSIANKIRQLHSWGENEIGYNYRLSTLQAEILRVKLKYFDTILYAKRQIANKYNQHFDNVLIENGVDHSYHIYPILRDNRNELINRLKNDVELRIHYPLPVHKLNAYTTDDYLPVTDKISSTQISLPIYPNVNYKRIMSLL